MRKDLEKEKKLQEQEVFFGSKHSRGEIAKEILLGLAAAGLIAASFALPNLPQVLKLFGIKKSEERHRFKRALSSLNKQRLINIYEKNGEQTLEISEQGRKKILKYKFDDMQIAKPKKWDGFWRIIAFDIPENRKQGRDALSSKLKNMNFFPLQKSVYVFPYECRNEIEFIGELFDVRKFIHYFIAKEIDRGDEIILRNYYNF